MLIFRLNFLIEGKGVRPCLDIPQAAKKTKDVILELMIICKKVWKTTGCP